MKTWTIGKKIVAGFASLIAIAILLGGVAVWKMSGVKKVIPGWPRITCPASAVANNVEREALLTMRNARLRFH